MKILATILGWLISIGFLFVGYWWGSFGPLVAFQQTDLRAVLMFVWDIWAFLFGAVLFNPLIVSRLPGRSIWLKILVAVVIVGVAFVIRIGAGKFGYAP